MLMASPHGMAASPFDESLCPASHQDPGVLSDKSPACYQQYKQDYIGAANLCVEARCPSGSKDLGAACGDVKLKSYLRTVSGKASCSAGQINGEVLCFDQKGFVLCLDVGPLYRA